MSFALCYILINCFMFLIYSLYICFFVLYVLLSILCVLCFCIVLCIASPHAHSCLFSICVQIYRPLSPSGKPVVVNKYVNHYHISFDISYDITHHITSYHIIYNIISYRIIYQKFYDLLIQCIHMFYVHLRRKSDSFSMQH